MAETGSFSLAAQKLHLTQPAVSKRVALLEDQLGTGLFDRIGRNVSLTEAGQALLPHARAVQQELDAAAAIGTGPVGHGCRAVASGDQPPHRTASTATRAQLISARHLAE